VAVERQMQALLALVDADRVTKCDAILGEARERAAASLAEAHAEARERMRAAFAEERARRDERVAAARANLQTRRRLAAQRRTAALLAAAWQRLPAALLARWRQTATRETWTRSVVAHAQARLPDGPWRITHAPGWPAAEREALVRTLGAAPEFVEDADAGAGLKIAAAGNVVDGTLAGLTVDRAEVGARLLQLLEDREAPA